MRKKKADGNVLPPCVRDTIEALNAERPALSARLDAIDLALANLRRVWLTQMRVKAGGPRRMRLVVTDSTDAVTRRELLLTLIGKSSIGLTLSELRKATPKMDAKARSNALQQLKAAKQIWRSGNTWVSAA